MTIPVEAWLACAALTTLAAFGWDCPLLLLSAAMFLERAIAGMRKR